MTDPLDTRKPTQRQTTMKAIADQAHRGLPPESEMRVYEFGNGTVQFKSGEYLKTWNESLQAWE